MYSKSIYREWAVLYQATLHTVLELKTTVGSDTAFSHNASEKTSEAQPHYQKSSTVGSCTPFSCFRPCPPPVHNAIMQSISWQIHQLLHLRILSSLSLSLSLPHHARRARFCLYANLKTHKASQSTWQLQAAHISLALFSQTWSWNWQITPLRAQPSPSQSLHHGSVQQHAAFNDNSAPTLSKRRRKESMRGANIYKPPRCERARWWLCGPDCFEFSVWCVLLRIESLPPSLLSCLFSRARPSSTLCHQEPLLQRYEEVRKPPKEVQKCADCCF